MASRRSRGQSLVARRSITLTCSMNHEKIGFKVLLIGSVMTGVGLVGIVCYLLFGIVPAIIAGLACVLYAIVIMGGRGMWYKIFVILLCLGITIVLAGITLICSMNQEKIGFKVLLIGGVMAGVGLVGIVYLLFGIVPAIIAGLACVLYAIVMILTS